MKAIILEIWKHSERDILGINFPLSNREKKKTKEKWTIWKFIFELLCMYFTCQILK